MTGDQGHFDIAIIGLGISGSSLRTILARDRLRVIISLHHENAGFPGEGAFRQHFFGDAMPAEAVQFFASESPKYFTTTLILQKRLGFRRSRTTVTRSLRAARG